MVIWPRWATTIVLKILLNLTKLKYLTINIFKDYLKIDAKLMKISI